jgi:hypothetical protein
MRNEFVGNPWNDFAKKRDCLYTVNAYRPGFHGDLQLIEIIENILTETSAFIETGTYHGCTSYYVSRNNPNLECFSCELDFRNFNISKSNTVNCDNLTLQHTDSINFLKSIIENRDDILDKKVLFWLDAHGAGQNEGPVLEEIKIITENFKNYYIFIDDVATPNSPQTKQFELGYLSQICCNFENCYIPNYNEQTGYSLTGWLLISSESLEPNSRLFERYEFK